MQQAQDFHLWAALQWYLAPAVMLSVSAAYFFADTRRPAYVARFVSSVHGLLGAALYCGAMTLFIVQPHTHRPQLGLPYAAMFVLPLAAVVASFLTFRGNRWIHLLQVINLLALAWALFIGLMAVTGDWL